MRRGVATRNPEEGAENVKEAPFMSETAARRIALFIDFENLVTNTGITPSSFDLQPSLDRLLEKGKVIFRRAYCDWSRFKEAKGHLHEFGVELVDLVQNRLDGPGPLGPTEARDGAESAGPVASLRHLDVGPGPR